MTGPADYSSEVTIARDFCNRIPGLQEAMRQRVADHSDYREWLQTFSPAVLAAVEEPASTPREQ